MTLGGGKKEVKLTCWRHATPYHAPLYLAQAKGFFEEQGIKVALLEPNDPSVRITAAPDYTSNFDADLMKDVTEIIGTGKVDLGYKAMIHTLAVRSHSRSQWKPLTIF